MTSKNKQPQPQQQFPQFDVVSEVSDHHFAGTSSKSLNVVHKKIMQEWKLLDKDLPESIFVRVYETRVDLLRAAIVGARGTPYHDGLFFFDIHFPSDYPARPPSVQYKSFGVRINPNLYANGRVCLSLLNTWTGKKSEKWDPNNSNILQVLLSIQALVLNEKPYFNEPGFGALSGKSYGEKKASAYNEDVFILSCKTMMYLLRRPPKHFEALVYGHFKDRAEFILNACDNYRKGLVKIGHFDGGQNRAGKVHVSTRFKDTMNQVYWDLVTELSKTGALLERFVEQAREEREKKEREREAAKKAKATRMGAGLGKNLVKTLKKIFYLGFKDNQKSKTIPDPVIVQAATA